MAPPCSAHVQPEPIKVIRKVAPGFADLNQLDGIVFAGVLTESATHTVVFSYPDLIAIRLDRVCGTNGDALVAPFAVRKRLGNESHIDEIVTIDIRRIVFQVLHGQAGM